MLRDNRAYLLAAVSVFLLCGLVRTSEAEVSGAYGMKVGAGSRLILGLDTGARYTSNFFRQRTDETSVIELVVRPSVLLLTDKGNLRYQLGADAQAGAADLPGNADDYIDGTVKGSFEWAPLTRHRFSGGASWRFDHDPFGTRRTEGSGLLGRRLDRWEQRGGNVVYHFGAPDATINLEGELGTYEREYQTNRASTQFLDHDVNTARGSLYYKISPKTRLVAEVIHAEVDYDAVAPGFVSRAGDVMRYRLGARWLATGKTTGDLRLGRVERDFDSSLQPEYDEFDWQATVIWEPRSRDRIRFSAGREPEESFINAARIIDHTFYDLSWRHDWTSLFNSTLRFGFDTLDFRGIDREDDVTLVSLDLEYKASRHWAVFADVSQRERDSNVDARDFDNTIVTTGIRLTY